MPKPAKKGSSQTHAQGQTRQKSKQKSGFYLKGKVNKLSDKQTARLRAAAQALLNNVGCGGISKLLEETGAVLNDKGIKTGPLVKPVQHAAQQGGMHAMDTAQHEQQMQSPLSVFQSQHPNTPVAPKQPRPDINALLSGWSLHTPKSKEAQQGQGTPASAAAAAAAGRDK